MVDYQSLFPSITKQQWEQLHAYAELLKEWNQKINLVSRKDTDKIFEHHILHSLSIFHLVGPFSKKRILDLGCGGGLPGIPLSIVNPNSQFELVDSRGKKIEAVQDMASKLGLSTLNAHWGRVEELKIPKVDLIISRAVARANVLVEWTQHLMPQKNRRWLLLKGGDLREEKLELGRAFSWKSHEIELIFGSNYFEKKYIIDLKSKS